MAVKAVLFGLMLSIGQANDVQLQCLKFLQDSNSPPILIQFCLNLSPSGKQDQVTQPPLGRPSRFGNCTRLPPRSRQESSSSEFLAKQDLQSLLKEGVDSILLLETVKEATLILGNTGTGKTTITQLIAGNTSRLHSVLSYSNKTIIIDEDGRIGLPSTKSKTLFPELVFDTNSSIAIYDCPGFDDSRGPEVDIAANYFNKLVTDHLTSVKLLFLVTYSSVKIGNDRLDFDRLASHAVKFMKNISKFQPNGFGLIVTKVNSYEGGEYLSDEAIKGEIIEFLSTYRETLQENLQNGDLAKLEEDLERNKLHFVESLLENDARKVWFSRSPDQCGPLSTIPTVMDSRSKIIAFHQRLNYSPTTPSDFGYSLKAKTLLRVKSFTAEINRKIKGATMEIAQNFKKTLSKTMRKKRELFKKETSIRLDYLKMKNLTQNLNNLNVSQHPELLLETATKVMNDVGLNYYEPTKTLRKELQQQGEFLDFFEKVTEAPVQRDVTEWISPLKDFVEAPLKNDHDWYNFLTSVYFIVSGYGFQQGKPTDDKVYSIQELPSIGIPVSSHILEILNSGNGIKQQDLNMLQEIVSLGVNSTKIHCSAGKMTVQGHFVKATDFVDSIGALCCEKTKEEVKILEIFATRTFFLDANIFAPREMQMSIVSPKWEIISTKTINLNGKDAADHLQLQASDGPHFSTAGTDGEPGLPGGNAGTFFGVGDNFVNLENLTITANGGNGGNGQHGGHGAIGAKGWDANRGNVGGCWSPANILPIMGTWSLGASGYSGSPGGRGGHGGTAGLPGLPGKIVIVDTSHATPPKVQVQVIGGSWGKVGRRGTGGAGGHHGDGFTCSQSHFWIFCSTSNCYSYTIHQVAEEGQHGFDGYNSNYQQHPSPRLLTEPEIKVINTFKSFYRAHHPPSFLESSFTQRLNYNEQINAYYTPTAFGEELLNLLSQPTIAPTSTSPVYQQFLNRLDAHIEAKTTNSQITPEEKKFFIILYATAMSKLYTMSQDATPTTVINVQAYLDVILERIENLKGIQAQVAIQQQRDLLHLEFQKKISTAQRFIQNLIIPKTTLIQRELDRVVSGLVQDVIRLQVAENNEEGRRKAREQIQSRMDLVEFLGSLFSGLKTIGKFLGVLGAEGSLIGETITATATVFESVVLSDEEKRIGRQNILQILKDDSHKDEDFAKIQLIFDQIVKIIGGNEKLSNTLAPAIFVFNETIQIFQNASHQPFQSLSVSQKLQNSITNLLQFLDKMENEYQLANQTESVETIQNLQNIVRVAGLGIDIYNQVQANEPALKEIASLAEKAEGEAKKLEIFKASIYTDVIPMIEKMNKDVGNATQNLATGTTSPVAIQMSKWKVKEVLNNLKFHLKKYTQGLAFQEFQENFTHLIEKLQDGLILMTDVYDQIEKYNDVKRLSNFMTSLSSPQEPPINDPTMLALSSNLKLATESHIFLAEYEKALHAFKQWVFPFAYNYQDLLNPVQHISNVLSANSSLQIELYKKQIRDIQMRLKYYKATSVGSHDSHLLHSSFYSGLRSSGPFFVWRNEKWGNSIGDILEGVEAQVLADIQEPGLTNMEGKGAVKFNLIELSFKVKEGGEIQRDKEQEELDETLKDFGVTMTHGGISRYKFRDEYFVMIGDNQTLRYNFERGAHGGRTGTNLVYEKFKNGDFLLSPYTLWTIQLVKTNARGNYSFNDLKKFSGLVDLELVGNGTYVDEKAFDVTGQDLGIEEYYEVDQFVK